MVGSTGNSWPLHTAGCGVQRVTTNPSEVPQDSLSLPPGLFLQPGTTFFSTRLLPGSFFAQFCSPGGLHSPLPCVLPSRQPTRAKLSAFFLQCGVGRW